jgi:hypothetical protein
MKPSISTQEKPRNKPNTMSTINNPSSSKESITTSKPNTHALEYNVIEYLKQIKANISLYDICTLSQQCDLILVTLNPNEP